MSAEILETLGQIAGIGGLSIGLLLFVFRPIIAKNIFPNLTKEQAYKLIRLIILLSFTAAIIGILGWMYLENKKITPNNEQLVKNINFNPDEKFALLVSGNGEIKKEDSGLIIELNDIHIKLDTVNLDEYSISKIILNHSFDTPDGYKNYNISKPIEVDKQLNKKNVNLKFDNLSFQIPLNHNSQLENSFFVLEIHDQNNGVIPVFSNTL